MPATTLTDAEIHARAAAYARTNQVSYSEALGHVTSFAETKAGADAGTNKADAQKPLSDAELHSLAVKYVHDHRVSYTEALRQVKEMKEAEGAQRKGSSKREEEDDAQLSRQFAEQDRRIADNAKTYARTYNVSFSEALGLFAKDAVEALQSQPIEIFRAGNLIDDKGAARVFSVDDIKAMAAAYNPVQHEAPLVLGHPDSNHPAYGWVKGLTATDDGRLLMQVGNVDPKFAEEVKAGRFKKRSASFYPPMAPSNPAPGQWYLRHVGWLGAQPPAVKSLADVNFGTAASDQAVCFSGT